MLGENFITDKKILNHSVRMNDIIKQITIPAPVESHNADVTNTKINIAVECHLADPTKPGKKIHNKIFMNVKLSDGIDKVLADWKKLNPVFQDKKTYNSNEEKAKFELYVKYNNRIFQNGTVKQCGIVHRSTVEIISLKFNKEKQINQGFRLAFWSIVPLMLATSFIIAGLTGRYDNVLRGAYILLGTIFGIPGLLCMIIGLSEYFSEYFIVAFTNDYWFGKCCCSCCSKKKDDEIDDKDIELDDEP